MQTCKAIMNNIITFQYTIGNKMLVFSKENMQNGITV